MSLGFGFLFTSNSGITEGTGIGHSVPQAKNGVIDKVDTLFPLRDMILKLCLILEITLAWQLAVPCGSSLTLFCTLFFMSIYSHTTFPFSFLFLGDLKTDHSGFHSRSFFVIFRYLCAHTYISLSACLSQCWARNSLWGKKNMNATASALLPTHVIFVDI